MQTHHRIEALVRAPRAAVYALLREPESHCRFHPFLERVVRLEEGRDGRGRPFLRFDAFERLAPLPAHIRIRATLHERVPGETLRFVSHTEPAIVVVSELHLADAEEGTRLVETVSFDAPALLHRLTVSGGMRAHRRLVAGVVAHFDGRAPDEAASGARPTGVFGALRGRAPRARRPSDRTLFA